MIALALLSNPALADHPPGATLPDVVARDVSDAGLNAFVPIAEQLLPGSIDIPVFEDEFCEEVCIFGCFCAYEYAYSISNGYATV